MKRYIDDTGKLISLLVEPEDWKTGLDFITEDHEFIQVGTWWYEKGKKLDRHYHNFVERSSNLTQECVVLVTGKMLVKLYDSSQQYLTQFTMTTGDFAIFFRNGHEYEILSDDTKIIEVKNGPFLGVNIDKTRF